MLITNTQELLGGHNTSTQHTIQVSVDIATLRPHRFSHIYRLDKIQRIITDHFPLAVTHAMILTESNMQTTMQARTYSQARTSHRGLTQTNRSPCTPDVLSHADHIACLRYLESPAASLITRLAPHTPAQATMLVRFTRIAVTHFFRHHSLLQCKTILHSHTTLLTTCNYASTSLHATKHNKRAHARTIKISPNNSPPNLDSPSLHKLHRRVGSSLP